MHRTPVHDATAESSRLVKCGGPNVNFYQRRFWHALHDAMTSMVPCWQRFHVNDDCIDDQHGLEAENRS